MTSHFTLYMTGQSDVGQARNHNEDAISWDVEHGFVLLADGMGGHNAGDVASQMIVNSLKKVHEGISLDRYIDDIEDRLISVNQKLIEKASQSTKRTTIGSTVVIFVTYNLCIHAGCFWNCSEHYHSCHL